MSPARMTWAGGGGPSSRSASVNSAARPLTSALTARAAPQKGSMSAQSTWAAPAFAAAMLAPDPRAVEERLRTLALALPEATEKLSHGAPAFFVAGKQFAYFSHNHHGDGMTMVGVKTHGRDEQDLLIEADPDTYSWPAYTGHAGWIAINLAE